MGTGDVERGTPDVKLDRLKAALTGLGRVAVALSGGVDSSLLVAVCADVPGLETLAVTAESPVEPSGSVEAAAGVARSLGIPHVVVRFDPVSDPVFTANPIDRCFFCREGMMGLIIGQASSMGFNHVADGSIADDAADYRPGALAARGLGVISPLADAGLTKADVRRLARDRYGLPCWDRPASPCLASRFPPGTEITRERLEMVRRLEDALADMGFRGFRARFFDGMAKLEFGPADMDTLLSPQTREAVAAAARGAGFHTVAVDLEPYRTGRMNELAGKIE